MGTTPSTDKTMCRPATPTCVHTPALDERKCQGKQQPADAYPVRPGLSAVMNFHTKNCFGLPTLKPVVFFALDVAFTVVIVLQALYMLEATAKTLILALMVLHALVIVLTNYGPGAPTLAVLPTWAMTATDLLLTTCFLVGPFTVSGFGNFGKVFYPVVTVSGLMFTAFTDMMASQRRIAKEFE